jgi:hypothetical protein
MGVKLPTQPISEPFGAAYHASAFEPGPCSLAGEFP